MNGAIATYAAALLLAVANTGHAQQPAAPTARDAMGTYALGTDRLFTPGVDACWLEVAPTVADSARVQILCRDPRPGHHLGVLDTRQRFERGKIVYETDEFAGHCRIAVTFARDSAVVTDDGNGVSPDRACGFGAYVDVGGTYRRVSASRPRFELSPIERSRGR